MLTQYIKVAAFPASLAGKFPLDKEHPERVIINFEMADGGGPVTPMKHKVWSQETLSPEEIADIHQLLCDGAVADFLTTGAKFVVLRHIR